MAKRGKPKTIITSTMKVTRGSIRAAAAATSTIPLPKSTQIRRNKELAARRRTSTDPAALLDPPLTRLQAAKLKRLPTWYSPRARQPESTKNKKKKAVKRLSTGPKGSSSPSPSSSSYSSEATQPPPTKRQRISAKANASSCQSSSSASTQSRHIRCIRNNKSAKKTSDGKRKEPQSMYINQMPPECLKLVLSQFTYLPELVKLRRVCRKWNNMVSAMCSWTRALRLNLLAGNATEAKTSYRSLYYSQLAGNPQPANQRTFTVRDRYWREACARSIGTLFFRATHLVIYYDLPDKRIPMSNLIELLRGLRQLNSFSFIMSTEVRNGNFLPRLAMAVNENLKELTRLDLFLSDYNELKQYEFHPEVKIWETLQRLKHFSLSCSPKNFYDMLLYVGRKKRHPERKILESLSIQCRLYDNDIPRLFESNPGLGNVRRLQLTCVWNREMVATFMKFFKEVRELQLCYCRTSWEIFDSEWINGLVNVENLHSLQLTDFGIDCAAGLIKNCLPKVKHLTLAAFDLFARFRADTNTRIFDGKLFCELLGQQFPNLETLHILAYEPEENIDAISTAINENTKEYLKELTQVTLDIRSPQLENAGPRPGNAARR